MTDVWKPGALCFQLKTSNN